MKLFVTGISETEAYTGSTYKLVQKISDREAHKKECKELELRKSIEVQIRGWLLRIRTNKHYRVILYSFSTIDANINTL